MAEYMDSRGVRVAASVKLREAITLLEPVRAGLYSKLRARVRELAAQGLTGGMEPDDQGRAMLEALLLGNRSNIDSRTYTAFRKTGLLHFISLSGLHLGILIWVVWWAGKTVGLLSRGRAAVCILVICVFLVVVPPRPPTLRAAVIALLYCTSVFFRRRPNMVNTLALAAIILVLAQPMSLFDAGLQLSFASVLGIVIFADRINSFIAGKLLRRKLQGSNNASFGVLWKVASGVVSLLSVGIGAWLGGAGIMLYHFHTITALTSMWTVLVFPLVALILVAGFVKIILSFVLATAASAVGVLLSLATKALTAIVGFISNAIPSEILVGHVPIAVVCVYYVLILIIAFAYVRTLRVKAGLCVIVALVPVLWLGGLRWDRTLPSSLRFTVLNVGHGQAVVADLPGMGRYVFDCGSLDRSDVGTRVVVPFLRYTGNDTIECMVLSHGDIDHINGVAEITEQCRCSNVVASRQLLEEAQKYGAEKQLVDYLVGEGVRMVSVSEATIAHGHDGRITAIWPIETNVDNELTANDASMVVSIEYAGKSIVLCSDIETAGQQELLRAYPELQADVVVTPHHGSANTIDQRFLAALQPDIVISSCGRTAYEKRRLLQPPADSMAFWTARDGAIAVRIDKKGRIAVKAFNDSKK
jgi:competence protein ComEC